MKSSIFLAIKIILFGFILPFRIWELSKQKLLNITETKSIKYLLDEQYIATSWLDLLFDAIIFIVYPIGLIIIIAVTLFTDISFYALLALIPLYFINLIISFSRELGGSFMLLHMNIKKIRKHIEQNQSIEQ